MHMPERHSKVVELAREDGRVLVDDLAQRFGVAPQTIRKDLNEICDRGLLTRIQGGEVGRRSGLRLFDSVAERPIPSPSLCRHPCQHSHVFVHVIDDERVGLAVVPSVQPSDVLRQRSLPGNRHGEE